MKQLEDRSNLLSKQLDAEKDGQARDSILKAITDERAAALSEIISIRSSAGDLLDKSTRLLP